MLAKSLRLGAENVWNELSRGMEIVVSKLQEGLDSRLGVAEKEDDRSVRGLLVSLDSDVLAVSMAQNSNWETMCVTTLEQARTCLRSGRFEVVLSPLRMSDGSGTTLIDLVVRQRGWLFLRTTVLDQIVWLQAVQEGTEAWGTRGQLAGNEFAEVLTELIAPGRQPASALERLWVYWHSLLRGLTAAFAHSATRTRPLGWDIRRGSRPVGRSTVEHAPKAGEPKTTPRLAPTGIGSSPSDIGDRQRIA